MAKMSRTEYAEETCDLELFVVELNHLELMGACMALASEKARDGLSMPQVVALEKLQEQLNEALDGMFKSA